MYSLDVIWSLHSNQLLNISSYTNPIDNPMSQNVTPSVITADSYHPDQIDIQEPISPICSPNSNRINE